MSGQVRSYEDYDEVYWNVTGNGWDFTIENAQAQIVPPKGHSFSIGDASGYTGRAGTKGTAYRTWINPYGDLLFRTNNRLYPREGLTISVTIPKGIFKEPSLLSKILEYLDLVIGLVGLILLLIYYYSVWDAVGRDPDEGTIIPNYSSPDKLSAADVRYLNKMAYDKNVFTASIIGLAVKGFLTIEKEGSAYTLKKKPDAIYSSLTNDELEVVNSLFPTGLLSIEIDKSNRTKIKAAEAALKKSLEDEHLKRHFRNNRGFFYKGLGITVLCLVLMILTQSWASALAAGFISLWLSIWTIGVFAMGSQALSHWNSGQRLAALPLTLALIPFGIGELTGIGFLFLVTSLPFVVTVVLLGVINFLFLNLLKAPTMAGTSLRSDIKGLKMYLETAEKDRFASMAPPERTLEHFEELFPFALALGVEQEWSEQFADLINKAMAETGTQRPLGWYKF